MRLRKKPWVSEAIKDYEGLVIFKPTEELLGHWREIFGNVQKIYVELGCGKGDFITTMAEENPGINFLGIEGVQDVLYTAAKKAAAKNLPNLRLIVFDINHIEELLSPGEVCRFYINFCDPWPKRRHAPRRLTHIDFLHKYRRLMPQGGEIFFKTDNRPLFDFSLKQFAAADFTVKNVTNDLHSTATDNVMTEYERKFSAMGIKINRAEAIIPTDEG